MGKQNYIRIFPNVDVANIKVSSDTTLTFEQAEKQENAFDKNSILKTIFPLKIIDAYHYGISKQNSSKIRFYRKTPDQTYYNYIGSIDQSLLTLSDYNVVNNNHYHYLISIENDIIGTSGENYSQYTLLENTDELNNPQYATPHFNEWSICDIEETEEQYIYNKVGESWNIGLNLSADSFTQNLGISSWDTLDRFGKISVGNKNYDSAQFSGLLGKMSEFNKYSFQDLQSYKQAKYNNGVYYTERMNEFDPYSVESEKLQKWKKFISNGKLKFIRDTKGNSWIAGITDSTQYQIDYKSNTKETLITFSWKEIKDSSKISIITIGE